MANFVTADWRFNIPPPVTTLACCLHSCIPRCSEHCRTPRQPQGCRKAYTATQIGDEVTLLDLNKEKFQYPEGYFAIENQQLFCLCRQRRARSLCAKDHLACVEGRRTGGQSIAVPVALAQPLLLPEQPLLPLMQLQAMRGS